MGWGKQDDGFYDHPKVMALPRDIRNDACGLYWRAVSYCNRQLTDGHVSSSALDMLDARPESVEALTRVHLFDRARDGRRIHDFLDFNFSREQVETTKKIKAEAGRQGGIKSGITRRKQRPTNRKAQPKHGASALVEANANPEPVPEPVPGGATDSGRTGATPPNGRIAHPIAGAAREGR